MFMFLTLFAKSINWVTRGDYVIWGTFVEIFANTEITPTDGTVNDRMIQWITEWYNDRQSVGMYICVSFSSFAAILSTPRCIGHRRVATRRCPRHRRVATPMCPRHRGVANCYPPLIQICPRHRGVVFYLLASLNPFFKAYKATLFQKTVKNC